MQNRKLHFAVLIILLLFLYGCTSKKINELPARYSEDWVKKGIIYQVDHRALLKYKTFDFPENFLKDIKKSGYTIISLSTIHPIGELNKKGKLGSSYAIKDHYGINPEFGTVDDFKSLVTTAHKLELKIIINLVANFASWDSQILMEHPEWFVHNDDGAIVSPSTELYDVAQFDFNQHEPRKYMISVMKYWIREMDIDGFICTASEWTPIEFWNIARKELEKIRPVIMISESDSPEHRLKAFDIGYSWNIGDLVMDIVDGKINAIAIDDFLNAEKQKYPIGSLHLRPIYKTDINTKPEEFKLLSRQNEKLARVLQFTLPGIPLIYRNEEINSYVNDLSEQRKLELSKSALIEFFGQLRNTRTALQEGRFFNLQNSDSASVFSFFRISDEDTVLVAINFSEIKKETKIQIQSNNSILWKDVASDKIFHARNNSLIISLLPLDYAILVPTTKDKAK